MPQVRVFSSPRIIEKYVSIHRLFMESTSFLTFCGGISFSPGIICRTIWGSFAGRDHLRACIRVLANSKLIVKKVRLLKVVQFSMLIHILGFSCFWKHHRLSSLLSIQSVLHCILYSGGALTTGSSGSVGSCSDRDNRPV